MRVMGVPCPYHAVRRGRDDRLVEVTQYDIVYPVSMTAVSLSESRARRGLDSKAVSLGAQSLYLQRQPHIFIERPLIDAPPVFIR